MVCFPGTVCIFLFLQLFLSSLPFSIPSVSGGGDSEAACSAPWLEGVVSGTRGCILRVQMLDLLTGSPPTTITSHPHTTFSADSATQAHTLFQCLAASCFCDISLTNPPAPASPGFCIPVWLTPVMHQSPSTTCVYLVFLHYLDFGCQQWSWY